MGSKKEQKLSYSEALAKLQAIVARLEEDSLELEEIEALVAEADALVRYSAAKLKGTQAHVAKMVDEWDHLDRTEDE